MRPLLSLLLLAGCVAGDNPVAPPKVDTQYVKINACSEVNAALRAAEVAGGTVDFNGLACTVSLELRSSPQLLQQVRFVRLTNCGGGLTPVAGQPVLKVAAGVSAYFVTVDRCLLFGTVDFSRMFNARFEQVWVLPPAGQPAFTATGAAYYNVFDQVYFAGGLEAKATGGPSTGPNSNTMRDSRSQTGVVSIGPYVQNWRFEDNSFEGCGAVCLSLAGTRIEVAPGNRFEGGSVGIDLLAGSDGTIGTQYWSSFTVARIRFNGADVANWVIAAQPGQQ